MENDRQNGEQAAAQTGKTPEPGKAAADQDSGPETGPKEPAPARSSVGSSASLSSSASSATRGHSSLNTPANKGAVQRRKPVILQVLPELVTGGVERGTVDMAEALVKADAEALVASGGGIMSHDVVKVGGKHFEMPLATKNILKMRANTRRLKKLIREQGVDLIHARSRAPAWSALWAARATGTPFVTTFHGTYNINSPLKRFYNSVMTRGDRVIAISDFIADHIRENYSIEDEKLRVVHRGVDMSLFDPERTSASRVIALSERWRLPDGVPVVMLPGRLTNWKGQMVLVKALAALGHQNVRCLLLGSDQGRVRYTEKLQALVQEKGLEPVVHIIGDCKDMPAAYMLADVVVSASTDPEGFGRVMAEAQAMGKPVIASDHGGAREIMVPGTGWLVPPGNEYALADALQKALTLTAEERARMAEKAVANVRARFTREMMCDRTLDIYEELLEEHWQKQNASAEADEKAE